MSIFFICKSVYVLFNLKPLFSYYNFKANKMFTYASVSNLFIDAVIKFVTLL